jgi:outer membrane protein insertion porin family
VGRSAARASARACRRLCASIVIVLAAAGAALAQDTSAFLGRTVTRVEISFDAGAAADDGQFRQAIERTVRAGKPLAADDVHESIASLVELGLASRAVVSVTDDGPAGVLVSYRVTRVLRVAALQFEGVPPEAAQEIRARLPELDTGQRVSPAVLARGADEIVRYYQERGFFEARARARTVPDETGTHATVVYEVTPGQQARVATFTVSREAGVLPGLEAKLRLKPNAVFTRADLEADLATIRAEYLAAGYLSPEIGTPEVVRNPAANTVAVSLATTSGPHVAVEVAGADFKQKDLERILPIFTEGGLDEFQLSEGDRRLADELQRDGYFFARVSHRVEAGATPGTKRVVYTVDRGRRFKITDVGIEGTDAISYSDVREQLRTQEAGFFILARGLTSRSYLQRDSDVIERRLRAIGYRKAKVVERRLGVSPDSDNLVVTFVVEEGPRTRVADVMLRGNRLFSREELLEKPALKPDEFYNEDDIATDADEILKKYAKEGFVTAEVSTELVDLDGERVRVVYDITEGRQAIIADIQLAGNLKTKASSIENYFQFKRGEVLRLDQLRETERKLYDTGAFSQVLIRSEPEAISPDSITEARTVYVDVEETKPWLLVYGGGFNTDDGPRGIFEISNVNLFGRLNTGALRLRASRRQQLGDIAYTNPVPFGAHLPATLGVKLEHEVMDAFDVSRFSTIAQLQKKLVDQVDFQEGFFFRYNFDLVRTFNLKLSPKEVKREDRPVRLGRLSTTYYRDTRNSPFDPDDGTFISLEGQLATLILGGNNQYVRLYSEYQRYDHVPKFDSLVYAGAVKFGLAAPYGDSKRLPISERFFSGGARTLRGFRFEQAGPRDPQTNEPVGGNVLLVINNELRFPLFYRFGGAVFSDTGNVFKKISDFDFGTITETVGAGIRFDTPVGPVRVDIGFLLNRPDGVKSYAVHLNFGQAF